MTNAAKNPGFYRRNQYSKLFDGLINSQELYEIATDQYYGWGYYEKDTATIAELMKYRKRYQRARLEIRTFLETAGNECYAIGNEITLFDMGIIR